MGNVWLVPNRRTFENDGSLKLQDHQNKTKQKTAEEASSEEQVFNG